MSVESSNLATGTMLRGARVGGLQLVEQIHISKHAQTWVARDEFADRCVVKILNSQGNPTNRDLQRIHREAKILELFEHEGIPRVFGLLTTNDNTPVNGFAMEWISGCTLRSELRACRRLSPQDVALLGSQLCDIISHVHRFGLVHADIKPANIIVAPDPNGHTLKPTLIDFHLARPIGHARSGVGTRLFASPEQARGGFISTSTDVWGLGVVMFRAATGKLPFYAAEGQPQIFQKAPRCASTAKVPGKLASVIDCMLNPRTQDRPTVAQVADALSGI